MPRTFVSYTHARAPARLYLTVGLLVIYPIAAMNHELRRRYILRLYASGRRSNKKKSDQFRSEIFTEGVGGESIENFGHGYPRVSRLPKPKRRYAPRSSFTEDIYRALYLIIGARAPLLRKRRADKTIVGTNVTVTARQRNRVNTRIRRYGSFTYMTSRTRGPVRVRTHAVRPNPHPNTRRRASLLQIRVGERRDTRASRINTAEFRESLWPTATARDYTRSGFEHFRIGLLRAQTTIAKQPPSRTLSSNPNRSSLPPRTCRWSRGRGKSARSGQSYYDVKRLTVSSHRPTPGPLEKSSRENIKQWRRKAYIGPVSDGRTLPTTRTTAGVPLLYRIIISESLTANVFVSNPTDIVVN